MNFTVSTPLIWTRYKFGHHSFFLDHTLFRCIIKSGEASVHGVTVEPSPCLHTLECSRPILTQSPRQIIITFPDDGTVVIQMLIGVMSDTHDNIVQTKKAVSTFNQKKVEHVLHAGDIISPFMIDTLKELKAPLTGVFGNNDGDRALLERKSGMLPSMKITGTFARIDVGGMRIALLHGNDRELFETLVACGSLDLLVYGHTHRPEIRREGSLLIVNPGEVYGHLTGRSTVALIDTVQRSGEIVNI